MIRDAIKPHDDAENDQPDTELLIRVHALNLLYRTEGEGNRPLLLRMPDNATRQLHKYLNRFIDRGYIAKDIERIHSALLSISKNISSKPDEKVLEFSDYKEDRILNVFEIKQNEIGAVMKENNIRNSIRDIILEKMALLSTKF